jgi:hypothetical protein
MLAAQVAALGTMIGLFVGTGRTPYDRIVQPTPRNTRRRAGVAR